MVAREPIRAGQLLLACQPLSVLHGEVDSQPDAALLADQLWRSSTSGALPQSARAALRQLYDGSPASLEASASLEALLEASSGASGSRSPASSPSSTSGAGLGEGAGSTESEGLTQEAAARLVRFNAFGDAYEDLAVARLWDAAAHSQVGLWPAFSLFNHSCAPNTVRCGIWWLNAYIAEWRRTMPAKPHSVC